MYNVVTVKPQILTDARLKSCPCPRLSYIWGCVLMAYSAGLLAEHKWNADATTIIVSQRGTGSLVCTICDTDDDTPVASSSIPDTLNLLVKWFGLNNAGGESGPLVLIFAVPSMTENTYFATQVLSMSSTSTIGDKGWIYFAITRGGYYAMWIHYYLHITIPTIELSNSTHLYTVSQSLYQHYVSHYLYISVKTFLNLRIFLAYYCWLELRWHSDAQLLQPGWGGRDTAASDGRRRADSFRQLLHRFCKMSSFCNRHSPVLGSQHLF